MLCCLCWQVSRYQGESSFDPLKKLLTIRHKQTRSFTVLARETRAACCPFSFHPPSGQGCTAAAPLGPTGQGVEKVALALAGLRSCNTERSVLSLHKFCMQNV